MAAITCTRPAADRDGAANVTDWLKLLAGLAIGVALLRWGYRFGDRVLSPRNYRYAVLIFVGFNFAVFISVSVVSVAQTPDWTVVGALVLTLGLVCVWSVQGALAIQRERTGR
jgi:hypothetical protein